MTQVQWEGAAILAGADRWEELEALMAEARRELRAAPTGGVPPSARGAATAFLSAWAGYAEESRAIAEGFAGALRDATADMTGTDEAQAGDYGQLDGRLGPER